MKIIPKRYAHIEDENHRVTAHRCLMCFVSEVANETWKKYSQKVIVTDILRNEALRKDQSGCVFSLNDKNLFLLRAIKAQRER